MNCRKRSAWATVLEIDYLDKINELGAAEFEVMQYEFKAESIVSYCKCESKKH
jgi:hypothetical protein